MSISYWYMQYKYILVCAINVKKLITSHLSMVDNVIYQPWDALREKTVLYVPCCPVKADHGTDTPSATTFTRHKQRFLHCNPLVLRSAELYVVSYLSYFSLGHIFRISCMIEHYLTLRPPGREINYLKSYYTTIHRYIIFDYNQTIKLLL